MAVERFAKHGAVALVENTAATFREHADADEAYVRGRVEGLAAQAAAGAGSDPTRLQLVRSACHALFVDAAGARIRGNEEDYYNPSNSFLSAVLRRSLGIPITMCTLLAAVCSRLGVTLRPVSFPMTFHLLLEPDRMRGPPEAVFVDAFGGGELRSREEMIAWLRERQYTGPVDGGWFEPCEASEVWARMLRNLIAQKPPPEATQASISLSDQSSDEAQ
jgi:regulator of sirC expression with transglutaminase-like and TPR domain